MISEANPQTNNPRTILIVEDDELLNGALCKLFTNAGYTAISAHSMKEALEAFSEGIALMVIDIGLPDGDGLTICRQVRRTCKTPVIFLTAWDDEMDMIHAFDCGADDYLVKPFPMPVLLKHVEAVLRRVQEDNPAIFCYEDLCIDFARKQVKCRGEAVKLTPKEYGLLELLARNKGKVLTKQILLERIWDEKGAFVEENTLNVTISRLKKKIEPDPSHSVYIKNVFGLGYAFGEL